LRVRLVGNQSNRQGVGAKVRIAATNGGFSRTRMRQVGGEDRWGTQEAVAHFDAGEAIRVLRIDVGLDPVGSQAPAVFRVGPGGEERLQGGVPSVASVSGELYRFSLDPSSAAAGSLVRVRVHLLPGADGLAGVSFALRYDPIALRPRSVTDLRLGALVPASALVLWNPATDSAVSAASGVIRFAAATARSWPTDEGLLAEVQFEVQSAAGERVLWPIVLERFELTRSGYDLVSGAVGTLNFKGRDVRPLQLHPLARQSDGGWGVQITGEPKSRIRVEASSDLVDWVVERDLDLDGDGIVRFLPGNGSAGGGTAPQESSRFYRAQLRD
jgi:hypothetical protein